MFEIDKEAINEIVINKSKFICIIKNISNKDDIENILMSIKKQYTDANHYCYAYIINNYKKYSDDKEPNGTAGYPILNVLEKEQLTNIICVVIRYFGGVKLGSGGLVRAYTKSVTECIKTASKVPYIIYDYLKITFDYNEVTYIDSILKDILILDKQFNEQITYKIKIDTNSEIINKIKKYIN